MAFPLIHADDDDYDDTPAPVPGATGLNHTSLPTDVAALHSIINSLQAELKATTTVNTHLAASVARFQVKQAILTPATTTTTTTPISTTTTPTTTITAPTTTPATTITTITTITTTTAPVATTATTATDMITAAPCSNPNHTLSVPSGRGAGSPEIFKKMIKTNRNGSLGRAHMADIDALPTTVLNELDCFLRRRLRAIFPRSAVCTMPDADDIFAKLATLGVRLEERSRYVEYPSLSDDKVINEGTIKRARYAAAYYYAYLNYTRSGYSRGCAVETLTELARYRGLFDDDGFVMAE